MKKPPGDERPFCRSLPCRLLVAHSLDALLDRVVFGLIICRRIRHDNPAHDCFAYSARADLFGIDFEKLVEHIADFDIRRAFDSLAQNFDHVFTRLGDLSKCFRDVLAVVKARKGACFRIIHFYVSRMLEDDNIQPD